MMLRHMEIAYRGEALDLLSIDTITPTTWAMLMGRIDDLWLPSSPRSSFGSFVDDTRVTATDEEMKAVPSLYIMIQSQCTGLIRALLERQLDCSPSACGQGRTTGLKCLSKISGIPFFDVNAMRDNKMNGTALLAAIHTARRDSADQVVELLLDCGADPNLAAKPGSFPLREALRFNRHNPDMYHVRLLLHHGADPNVPMTDCLGQSALAEAVRCKNENLVHLLLSSGAKVHGHSEPSPLCIAAAYSSPSVVRVLLAAGANVGDRSEYGRTALHDVVLRSRWKDEQAVIAQDLLKAGVEIDEEDDEGETPVTLAFDYGRIGLAKLFLDRGASLDMPGHREIAHALCNIENDYSAYDPLHIAQRSAHPRYLMNGGGAG
jgi:ankyrin repeat protein